MKDEASSTALLVAKGVWLTSQHPKLRRYVPTGMATKTRQILQRTDPDFLKRAGRPIFRNLLFAAQSGVLPGIFLHYVLRKRSIENKVRDSIFEGFGTVVVLGAGFDTLAMRLADQFHGVKFVEEDHPATSRLKSGILAELGSKVDHRRIDLTQPINSKTFCFGQGEDVIFVAEGLLMYLPPAQVESLFRAVATGSGRRRIVFTAMGFLPDGRPGFTKGRTLIGWWLNRKREPFLWGLSPSEAKGWLHGLGFELTGYADPDELRREFQVPSEEALAKGEYLYVAELPANIR
jgi:methyltransferase (TIGR00027 family)